MDDIDRALLVLLQHDASRSYASLGESVGLSTGAAHERVRKLRQRGVIRRTTVEVDPGAVGRGVLAFVMIEGNAWMGDTDTGLALSKVPEIQEAHVVAGSASVLVKIGAASTADLQSVLRGIYDLDGVTATRTIVVLDTFFERAVHPAPTSIAKAG